jgi:transposase-like protein
MGTKDKGRRAYPKEFKAEAAAPAGKHEKPVRQASADLGVNENMLRRRVRQFRKAWGQATVNKLSRRKIKKVHRLHGFLYQNSF